MCNNGPSSWVDSYNIRETCDVSSDVRVLFRLPSACSSCAGRCLVCNCCQNTRLVPSVHSAVGDRVHG
jgi:hypothetical protein